MIKLENFSKSYKTTAKNNFSVKDVSFEIKKGSVTALIGPNGCGKTTIIKAICGFHYPTLGNITVTEDENLSEKCESDKLMEIIGYVPEKSILPQNMYVYNYLNFVASVHNLKDDKKNQAIGRVVKEFELEDVLSKKIKTLSKGYQQRVSFAQALIHNPPNLILDEPITGLDPKQIMQMRNLIKKLSKDKAILLSTHIFQEVTSLCDNIIIINKGKLITQGSEENIIKQTNTKNLDEAFIKLTDKDTEKTMEDK